MESTQIDQIKSYTTKLAKAGTELTLDQLTEYARAEFYPDRDFSFVEYLDRISIHETNFIVGLNKLVEYGVLAADEKNIESKLYDLGADKDTDYIVQNIVEHGPAGNMYTQRYYLTPRAFKIALIRAETTSVYFEYFSLIETVCALYMDYQRKFNEAHRSI